MFGIGSGELLLIALIALVAVGPKRMPTLMKSLGRAMREFRRATNELRSQTGIDSLLGDEDLRNPMRPKSRPLPRRDVAIASADAAVREHPAEGVDIAEARVGRSGASASVAQSVEVAPALSTVGVSDERSSS